MVLLEFAMAPRGHEQSLSADVARIVDIIDRSGLPYQLTAMGTLLEGEWDEVMGVVSACFEALKGHHLPVSHIRREKYVSPPDPKARVLAMAPGEG